MRVAFGNFVNRSPLTLGIYTAVFGAVFFGVAQGIEYHSASRGIFEGAFFGVLMGVIVGYRRRSSYRADVSAPTRTKANLAIKNGTPPQDAAVAREMLHQVTQIENQDLDRRIRSSYAILGMILVLNLYLALTQNALWFITSVMWVVLLIGNPIATRRLYRRADAARERAQAFLNH